MRTGEDAMKPAEHPSPALSGLLSAVVGVLIIFGTLFALWVATP